MKFATFIVVDDTFKKREKSNFTVNGDVIYPLGTPMPVILKGSGCIGVGIVLESTRKGSSTSITFKLSKTDKASADAYYDLYRNQISVSSDASEDAYDNAADMVIPGMMAGANIKPKLSEDDRGRSRKRSLSDFMDDDDDYHW